jgi:hypothetical protein
MINQSLQFYTVVQRIAASPTFGIADRHHTVQLAPAR